MRALPARRRDGFVALLACTGLLLATGLAGASVHIVGWRGGRADRLAFLPIGPEPIAWLLVVACAVGIVGWWATRRGYVLGAPATAPLLLVWLWALPYTPGLPGRWPLLLLLAGPLRWAVLGWAVAGSAWPALARAWDWLSRVVPTQRRALLAVSLLVYAALGLMNARQVGPGGDEPHYLVIAHSLLVDHDLQIENNHRLEHYAAFYGRYLPPHYLRRGVGGVIYSVHAPGLPALVLPAYAAGGYYGVVLFLAVLAALAARAVYDLAEELAGRAAALTTWAAVTLTLPFVPHAWLIYPELPATLVTAWAAGWLWRPPPRDTRRWLGRGLVLAILPWLHTKFVLLLAALLGALLLRRWAGFKPALACVVPVGLSVASWLAAFYVMYGVADPTVPYGSARLAGLSAANIPRGVLGLVFDQEFGVLFYSPVYLLVVPGAWTMLRRPDWRGYLVALGCAIVALVGSVSTAYMWWGGFSAPARFLVPTLPLVAPLLAVATRADTAGTRRPVTVLLLGVSLAIAALVVGRPARLLAFNDRDGTGKLVELVQGGAPLASVLPTLLEVDWAAELGRIGVWLGAILAGAAGARMARRLVRSAPRRTFWIATGALLGFAGGFVLLATTTTVPEGRRAHVVQEGRLRAWAAYDGARTLVVRPDTVARLDEAGFLAATSLAVRPPRGGRGEDEPLVGPLAFVPGEYEVRLWFHGERPGAGETALVSARALGPLARVRGNLASPTRLSVRLPVPVADVWVRADAELAPRVRAVEIQPRWIEPRRARVRTAPVRAVEAVAGRTDAYVVYLDAHAYPEGGRFWTVGGAAAEVWIAPAGAGAIVLRLHVGPRAAPVDVTVRGAPSRLELAPWEPREVWVPVRPGERLIPVRVATSAGFRPSSVDPASRDHRWLGCFVEVGLADRAPAAPTW